MVEPHRVDQFTCIFMATLSQLNVVLLTADPSLEVLSECSVAAAAVMLSKAVLLFRYHLI